jgi:NADH-quinone oxidoreductase subunit L
VRIKLFANKFYFDEIYAVIVRVCQDRLAWIVTGSGAHLSSMASSRDCRRPSWRASGPPPACCRAGICKVTPSCWAAAVIAVVYLVVFVLPRMGH